MQALLCSIWTTDVSGSIALLGLFAVYMASQELLVLFMVFIPASILVDFMRGLGGGSSLPGYLSLAQFSREWLTMTLSLPDCMTILPEESLNSSLMLHSF